MRHTLTLSTADGTTQHTLQVPVSWHDVTLQEFIDWQCSDEPAICCLAGISRAVLEQLAWQDAGYLLNLLSFAAELPNPPPAPDLVDPGEASYGQMLLVQQYLAEHPEKPDVWYAPRLYAIYRSQQVYRRYDQAKIDAMDAAIRAAPVGEVLGSVLFTSAVWLLSTRATRPTPTTKTPGPTTPRSMPGWRSWATGLARETFI
ncbi:hypothetical protein [Hymenobacter sp. B81]|uniref:hypothetical protein n=1 Tax=Hymenobacter sp. B81 TaxID=3344878 RepID=UPI0037DC7D9B